MKRGFWLFGKIHTHNLPLMSLSQRRNQFFFSYSSHPKKKKRVNVSIKQFIQVRFFKKRFEIRGEESLFVF